MQEIIDEQLLLDRASVSDSRGLLDRSISERLTVVVIMASKLLELIIGIIAVIFHFLEVFIAIKSAGALRSSVTVNLVMRL